MTIIFLHLFRWFSKNNIKKISLYFTRSYFYQSFKNFTIIYNISFMGKKLRNRQLIADTDFQNEDSDDILPIKGSIGPSYLIKKIKSRIPIKKQFTEHKLKRFQKRLDSGQFTSILNQSMFNCPICLELIVSPIMMSCGHTFCNRCVDSNSAFSRKCCLCRKEQKEDQLIPSGLVQKIIQKFILPNSSETFRYLCKITDSVEWFRRRKLTLFRENLVIDFLDRWGLWKKGVITKILSSHKIQVRTTIKNVDIFDKVEKSSSRIAPFTFFTKGKHLLDFPPMLLEFDPSQKMLERLQYRPLRQSEDNFEFRDYSFEIDGLPSQEKNDEILQLFDFEMINEDMMLDFF